MGILNIVIGSLTLLCGLCDVLGYAFVGSLMNAPGENPVLEELKYLEKRLPGYLRLEIGRDVVILVLAVLLIMAGIGLLMTRGWGRWLAIIYAFVSIPVHAGWAVYKLGVVLPLADEWQKEYARQHLQQMASSRDVYVTGAVLVLAITILPLIYCLILLVFMFLPGLSAVFAQARRPSRDRRDGGYGDDYEEPDGGEDDYGDYDERWRDRS
jgi:hypothetical protein